MLKYLQDVQRQRQSLLSGLGNTVVLMNAVLGMLPAGVGGDIPTMHSDPERYPVSDRARSLPLQRGSRQRGGGANATTRSSTPSIA